MNARQCRFGVAVFCAAVSACTASPTPGAAPRPAAFQLITRHELRVNSYSTALDAVTALHPQWMSVRGTDTVRGNSSPSQVLVYFDNVKIGGVEALGGISITGLEYIRYYDRLEATARWGIDHGQGVIFVSSRPLP